jgi:hypothetical protein
LLLLILPSNACLNSGLKTKRCTGIDKQVHYMDSIPAIIADDIGE